MKKRRSWTLPSARLRRYIYAKLPPHWATELFYLEQLLIRGLMIGLLFALPLAIVAWAIIKHYE